MTGINIHGLGPAPLNLFVRSNLACISMCRCITRGGCPTPSLGATIQSGFLTHIDPLSLSSILHLPRVAFNYTCHLNVACMEGRPWGEARRGEGCPRPVGGGGGDVRHAGSGLVGLDCLAF